MMAVVPACVNEVPYTEGAPIGQGDSRSAQNC